MGVDAYISAHNAFLDSLLLEVMLLNPGAVRHLEQLKNVCLHFCEVVGEALPVVSIADKRDALPASFFRTAANTGATANSVCTEVATKALCAAAENAEFDATVAIFEQRFAGRLGELLESLRAQAQFETLCQKLEWRVNL